MFELEKYAVCIVATVVLLILEACLSCGIAALENISENSLKKMIDEGNKKGERLWMAKQGMEEHSSFVTIVMTALNLGIGFFHFGNG